MDILTLLTLWVREDGSLSIYLRLQFLSSMWSSFCYIPLSLAWLSLFLRIFLFFDAVVRGIVASVLFSDSSFHSCFVDVDGLHGVEEP